MFKRNTGYKNPEMYKILSVLDEHLSARSKMFLPNSVNHPKEHLMVRQMLPLENLISILDENVRVSRRIKWNMFFCPTRKQNLPRKIKNSAGHKE
jgi:hypothetical protein